MRNPAQSVLRTGVSISRRLVMSFTGVLLVTMAGSAIGYVSLARTSEVAEAMVQDRVITEQMVSDAYRLQSLNTEPEVGEVLAADIAKTQQPFDPVIHQVYPRLAGTHEKTLWNALVAAAKKSQSAAMVAKEGGQSVLKMVGTLPHIEQSAYQIADITKLIDGIAFQAHELRSLISQFLLPHSAPAAGAAPGMRLLTARVP